MTSLMVENDGLAQPATTAFRDISAADSRPRQIRGALVTYFSSN